MHSLYKSDFYTLRSAMWLVLDIIDDLTELEHLGERYTLELGTLRNHAMDILFDARKLENRSGDPSPVA